MTILSLAGAVLLVILLVELGRRDHQAKLLRKAVAMIERKGFTVTVFTSHLDAEEVKAQYVLKSTLGYHGDRHVYNVDGEVASTLIDAATRAVILARVRDSSRYRFGPLAT